MLLYRKLSLPCPLMKPLLYRGFLVCTAKHNFSFSQHFGPNLTPGSPGALRQSQTFLSAPGYVCGPFSTSPNPHCTAVFRTVPRNKSFSVRLCRALEENRETAAFA